MSEFHEHTFINPDDRHKWERYIYSEDTKIKGFISSMQKENINLLSAHICTRGDCKCIRLNTRQYRSFMTVYFRSNIYFSEKRPDCFGDIPINQQNID